MADTDSKEQFYQHLVGLTESLTATGWTVLNSASLGNDFIPIEQIEPPTPSIRIKIISDGTPHGTKVINVDTGQQIANVEHVDWAMGVNGVAHARVELVGIPVEVTAKDVDMIAAQVAKAPIFPFPVNMEEPKYAKASYHIQMSDPCAKMKPDQSDGIDYKFTVKSGGLTDYGKKVLEDHYKQQECTCSAETYDSPHSGSCQIIVNRTK